jgi:CubicO group peptidase (beta-lactamase class C family)
VTSGEGSEGGALRRAAPLASAGRPARPVIDGFATPAFAGVRDAFAENLERRGELGAAFAVTLDGEPVVDLWGGVADAATGRPWERDTLQVIFSGTKGLVALCLLMLVDRGQLELDAPVARFWPEFAAHGKEHVRVVEVASHQARLPGIRAPVDEDEMLDDRRMAALLADQAQEEDPRARDAYHALTYGWLCGELVRRVDGRSVGRFFAEEVARPLGLELWIGLPAELEERVSTLRYGPRWGRRLPRDAEAIASDELLARVWDNPPLFPQGRLPWNRADYHRAEIPGAGGVGTARSLARLYGCLARGGELDGVQLLSAATLAEGRRERTRRWEPLVELPMAFGVGFQLQTELRAFGPAADAFGHGGAGGSIHCAWPARRAGISYAMNLMSDDEPDPRAQALLTAVHDALRGIP